MKLERFFRAPTDELLTNLPAHLHAQVLEDGSRRAFVGWQRGLAHVIGAVLALVAINAAQRFVESQGLGDGPAVWATTIAVGSILYALPHTAFHIIFVDRRVRRGVAAALTARGHCSACGYSLAGNASGVCPECGTSAGKERPS